MNATYCYPSIFDYLSPDSSFIFATATTDGVLFTFLSSLSRMGPPPAPIGEVEIGIVIGLHMLCECL